MKITSLSLTNIRAFPNAALNLSPTINLLVGPNNAGKSTILHSILSLQFDGFIKPTDLRLRKPNGEILFHFINNRSPLDLNIEVEYAKIALPGDTRPKIKRSNIPNEYHVNRIISREPDNFIYPFLSKRKTAGYSEQMNIGSASDVTGNLNNLYAKIDRVSNPTFLPAYDDYKRISNEVLGFVISTTHSVNGKKAAFVVRNIEHISLDVMGEGVATPGLSVLCDLRVKSQHPPRSTLPASRSKFSA
jgi:hypothetical protein